MKKILVSFFLIIISNAFICHANDFEKNKQTIKDQTHFLKSHWSCVSCKKEGNKTLLPCCHLSCGKFSESKNAKCPICQITIEGSVSLEKEDPCATKDPSETESIFNIQCIPIPVLQAILSHSILSRGAKRAQYTLKAREEVEPPEAKLIQMNTPRGKPANGFFYSPYEGAEDCWRCFACGLGITYWSPTDDSLIDHTLYSKCPFNFSFVDNNFILVSRVLYNYKHIAYFKKHKDNADIQSLENAIMHALDEAKALNTNFIEQGKDSNKVTEILELKNKLDQLKEEKESIIEDFNEFTRWINQQNEHEQSIEDDPVTFAKLATTLLTKEPVSALLGYNRWYSSIESDENKVAKEAWKLHEAVNKKTDALFDRISEYWGKLQELSPEVKKIMEARAVFNLQEPESLTCEEVINAMLACDLKITEGLQDQIMEHFLIKAAHYNKQDDFRKIVNTITTECANYNKWKNNTISQNSPEAASNVITIPFSKLEPLFAKHLIQWAPDFARRKALETMIQLNAPDFEQDNMVDEVIKLLMSLGYTFDQKQENYLKEKAQKLYPENKYSMYDLTINCLEALKTQKIIADNLTATETATEKKRIFGYAYAFGQFKKQINLMQCAGCHKNLTAYLNLDCKHHLCKDCRFYSEKCPVCNIDIHAFMLRLTPK